MNCRALGRTGLQGSEVSLGAEDCPFGVAVAQRMERAVAVLGR